MKQLYSGFLMLCCLLLCVSISMAQQKPSNPNNDKTYRDLLVKNAPALGIPKGTLDEAFISDAYTDDVTGITFMYVQQHFQGIKLHNTIISAAFKNGMLQSAKGSFVPALAQKINSSNASKSPVEAVRSAARHLQLNDQAAFTTVADHFAAEKAYKISAAGIAKKDMDVTLVYVPSEDKQTVTLAWNVNIDVAGSPDWWNVRINAFTGEYLEKNNWTVHEDHHPKSVDELPYYPAANNHSSSNIVPAGFTAPEQTLAPPNVTSATYRVIPFPAESPLYGSFSNVNNPWLLAGAGNNATTHGWHFDGTNNYTITRGNNVFTYLDRANTNSSNPTNNWPDTSSTAVPSLTFVNTFNTTVQPQATVENRKAAVDNLFYWNNIIHDVTYQYGFTEAAGNFQADNLGRGGAGNDFVNAHAQDAAGFNNANFATPNDGGSPRMQMYLWATRPTLTVTSPAAIAGNYASVENSFTAPNKLPEVGPITGQVVQYNSGTGPFTACAAALNPASLAGKIVLIDFSACTYISKVKNAQNAGAIGVLMYSTTIIGMGGTDPSVTIPCVSITTATANTMLNQINLSNPVTVTLTGGIRVDGDFDNGIVVHEYGHGVSNRLTGGPVNASCLTNAEQAGEGWSDFLALMITTNWAGTPLNAGPLARPMGNFALNQSTSGYGIRQYPYSTDMAINPLTYTNVTVAAGVHSNGTVWCTTLWDMTWNIIAQTGAINPNVYNASHNGGNAIAFNLVMMGMKLQPCSPGFLDSRDAILAADSILYNGAYRCAIWAAFAKRGMGFSAKQGSSNNAGDQTPAFDLPTSLKVASSGVLQLAASTTQTINHTLTCDCSALTNQVVRDTLPPGFTFVSSSPAGATVSGNVVTFPATSFAAREVKTFSITVQTPAAGCAPTLSINDNRDANTTGGLTATGWSPVTNRSYSPTSSWFSTSPETPVNSTLTTPPQTLLPGNNLSIFSFWHYFNTEVTYDGGAIEYSTDGSNWLDAGPYFIKGSYNTTMAAGSALPGRKAFSGTNLNFEPVMLNLSNFAAGPVQIRFRNTTDNGVAGEGWYVDDIVKMNGCGGILKTGVYNASNVLIDTTITPVFVISGPVPLSLLSFDARANNNAQVSLIWRTTSEINVAGFDVEWSSNGNSWSTIATVAARNLPSNLYSTLHTEPTAGINFYRLKMKDLDGSFSYSETKSVNILQLAKTAVTLVPNPVSMEAVLYIPKYNNPTTVKIFDATGSLVQSYSANAGTQQLKISTAKLAAGIYIIETNAAERTTTKMVVQK